MKYFIKARNQKWKEVSKEDFNKYAKFLKTTFDVVGAKTEAQRKEFLSRYTKIEVENDK